MYFFIFFSSICNIITDVTKLCRYKGRQRKMHCKLTYIEIAFDYGRSFDKFRTQSYVSDYFYVSEKYSIMMSRGRACHSSVRGMNVT